MPDTATPAQDVQLEAHEAALALVDLRTDDAYGARVGRVAGVLVDRESGAIRWLQLRLTGLHVEFLAVPVQELTAGAGNLHLPWARDQLMIAPRIPEPGALTSRLERRLRTFWGISEDHAGTLTVWERRATCGKLVAPGEWIPAPRAWQDAPAGPAARPTGSVKPDSRRSILGAGSEQVASVR